MVLLLGDWVPEQEQPLMQIDAKNELVLLNIEGPLLTDVSAYNPIVKSGPHLCSTAPPNITDAAAVCCSLANNHIKDYGWPGVQTTLTRLSEQQYFGVGVGENECLARVPLLLTVADCRYAIFSFCETQVGRATSVQSGCAILGPWVYQAIANIRPEVDRIIVSIHMGNEMLPWPSPFVQDLYRSYIDAGADIVHGHHPHVPQGVEKYKNGVICYGLGNFVGSPCRYKHFEAQHSLGVRISLSKEHIDYQIEPYHFFKANGYVVVEKTQSDKVMEYIKAVQEPLTCRPLLEALWQEAALWLYDYYGRDSMGLPYTTERRYSSNPKQYLKSFVRRSKRLYAMTLKKKRENQILWYNMTACLSHQHMMETALGLLCGEITDVRTTQAREMVTEHLSKITTP